MHWVDQQRDDDEHEESLAKAISALGGKLGGSLPVVHASGAVLDPEAIKVARKEELKIFVKIRVDEKKSSPTIRRGQEGHSDPMDRHQ